MTAGSEERLLQAISGVKSDMNSGFDGIRKELGEVGKQTASNSQRLNDLRCDKNEKVMSEIKEEVVQLKISDVTQDGELKLKFSMSSLLLQLLIGMLAMVPVGIGAYIAIQKAIVQLSTG